MPSLQSVLEFRKKMFAESMDLIEKKGHDYNRKQQNAGDTLFNLKVCALLGIVDTPEQGVLVRLSDKFMRLISLMAPGVEAQVKDESVRVTVHDFHNYLDYALQMWEEKRALTKPQLLSPSVQLDTPLEIKQALAARGIELVDGGKSLEWRRNTTQVPEFTPPLHHEVPHGSGFGVIRDDEFKMKRPTNE